MEDTREELKSAISKLGEMGRGKRYPRPLLEKMLSYTVARRRQGATLLAVGGEMGMNWKTLARWVGARKTALRFERVQGGCARSGRVAPEARLLRRLRPV